MRPLNIVLTAPSTIASQFFDYFYAYWQSRSDDCLMIEFSQDVKLNGSINICVLDQTDQQSLDLKAWEKFDFVLLDNRGESLENSAPRWADLIREHHNIFLLCGAIVPSSHDLYDKIICYNHNLTLFTDCVCRPFYPQHFDLKHHRSRTSANSMVFINGQNRVWRQYFIDCLFDTVQDQITIKNSYNSIITKLLDCEFESCEDTQFRQWLNDSYTTEDIQQEHQELYYSNSVPVGIGDKFGSIPPGYFFLPEYFDQACIIYPETSWINDSLFVTEKTWKCFVSRAIPWPISGANFHSMLNSMGFMTARDLLPDDLKSFDKILDHRQRHIEQTKAIQWALEHPTIWQSPQADICRKTNFERFWNNDFNLIGLQHFEKILHNV